MHQQRKPLYDTILEELRGMVHIEVEDWANLPCSLSHIHNLGEIVISYKTEEHVEKRFFGFKKETTQVPLSSQRDVRNALSQNPEIGEPNVTRGKSMMFARLLNPAESSKANNYYVRDQVTVLETPWLTEKYSSKSA
jgi:hypothetical protein